MSTHNDAPPVKSGFYSDLRQYVFTHNILAIATGWGIGNATRELIARLIDDIFMPILSSAIGQNKLQAFVTTLQSSSLGNAVYLASSVTWDFLIWIAVILLTFALLEYVLYRGILVNDARTVTSRVDSPSGTRLVHHSCIEWQRVPCVPMP